MNRNGPNAIANTGSDSRTRPIITEAFSSYEPPGNVAAMVRRMLDSVPEKYLSGLTEIVLTNMNALSRSRRRSVAKSRRRKVRVELARGMYHPAFENRGAWIEIFVDNTLRLWGRRWWLAWLRDMELSGVLFHEIGHHIHYTARPEYREKEDVADVWKVRLQKTYQRGRYPWLRLLLRCSGLGTLFKHIEYRHRWMFRKGYISRAEYEESIKLGKGDKVPNQS